jgi:hypothetical protein
MVGGCLVDLANNSRHAEIASSLLAFLLEKIDSSRLYGVILGGKWSKCQNSKVYRPRGYS